MHATAIRTATPELTERPRLRTETVSDYRAFLNLEPAWNRLVRVAGIEHPFLEHAWLRTWWDCFGADAELRIVTVREGNELLAIAPLMATTIRMWGIPVRRLGFLYNAHVPRADFIVAGRAEEAYRAIWNHLLADRKSWDLLQLCQLPEGSSTLHNLRRLADEAGLANGIWCSGESPWISVDRSWPEYYGELTSKFRSNLRNRFRRLSQMGTVAAETVIDAESLPEALDSGWRLETSGWKRDEGTAIASDPRVREFYESFAHRAALKGWLRLNFLKAGDTRAAFEYSLSYNNRVFLLKNGYDPAFSAFSPSNLLVSMTLERAFEQRMSKYDFLGDAGDWKRCWTKNATASYWLSVFAGGPKGRFLHFAKFRLIPLLKGREV